jgi:hypothetical protein
VDGAGDVPPVPRLGGAGVEDDEPGVAAGGEGGGDVGDVAKWAAAAAGAAGGTRSTGLAVRAGAVVPGVLSVSVSMPKNLRSVILPVK